MKSNEMCIVIQRIKGDGNDTMKRTLVPHTMARGMSRDASPLLVHRRKRTRRDIAGAKAGSCKYTTAALILQEHGHERLVGKSDFTTLLNYKHYSHTLTTLNRLYNESLQWC